MFEKTLMVNNWSAEVTIYVVAFHTIHKRVDA